jgi:hypothetical protein
MSSGEKGVRAFLGQALEATCSTLASEVRLVPLEYWNESVLRFLLVRHLRSIERDVTCWSEWNRVDLVLPGVHGATLVELKFFTHQPLRRLGGEVTRLKGGPSKKNVREFQSSVQTLAEAAAKPWAPNCGGVVAAFLVLAFCDRDQPLSKPTYGEFYDSLEPDCCIISIKTIVERMPLDEGMNFSCKLLEVRVKTAAGGGASSF